MSPEQIAEKMKSEIQQGSALTQATLIQLKKYFDDLKNNQNSGTARPQELFQFKERIIGYLLSSLNKGQHSSKDKIIILEILERDLISTKHNVNLFNKLYLYLTEEDENVAVQASKAIDALIKQINEGTQATPAAVPLDTKLHYLKLFEFLKDKTEFLIKLADHAREPEFKVYRRQVYEEKDRDRQKEKQKDKKEIVFKNTKSLKFINQVPHLFIHLMAYVDINNRSAEDDNKIKELIRKSIDNIIQSLRKTPYQQFYNEFNYEFNNQLFGVMTKLLQFLFINLRSDKEQSGNANKSNLNLKKHISDQIEFIRVPEVIKNFIYLLKNCSQDFQLNRYEIVNRLKLLLNNLDKNKLGKADAIEIMNEILNQETIFGKKKILGDYSKNAICSYWIQMIRSPVLIANIFPTSLLSVRTASQQPSFTEDNPQIANCFLQIQRLFEEVLKTIFDNTFYPSVQEKCIELITYLIDQLFPQGSDQADSLALLSANSAAKKIQENKLKILLRILDCASLKFMSIRHIFQQIDDYVTRKLGHKITKKELPEPLKLQHMQLNSLNLSIAESQNWEQEAVEFIERAQEDIDGSLLTVSVVQNKFITIYQEEDELCFNSHPVKLTNYTLYMKEVKTKLLEKCITLAHKITKTFLSQNIQSYNPMEVASLKTIYFILSNKKALTSDQCRILSSILKNGLKIFQILHNYDLHSDDQTNKKGHLKNFMLIFAQIYDPVNFRDIFEPNMNDFFRNLITYAKNCADYCLQFVLIEPYCSNNNQTQPFNKNIVELLTYNLILRLESTSDQLDPFHEFYDYKQEYFLLLQKLIRFPFRCLSRYSDQSFIRNYFRQIILFLTKKAHTSRFCLDYLHLMRTLFKNILFNSNRQAASPLFSEFYAICCKNSQASQAQSNTHSIFINVNILDNFLRFYETGIPELADIVTELVIMLPLKSKHIIQFAKQGYIVKPLLHCLCLMSDYNYLLRTLKTFQIIISHSTAQEINQFLEGVKDKLINRLFEMVISQYKSVDLKPDKINNDLSSLSLKLLAKLGALSRNRDIPIQMRDKYERGQNNAGFEIVFKGWEEGKRLSTSMSNCIEYAIEIFHKLLDSYYQSIIFISMEMIEKSFQLLLNVLPVALARMHPLAQKIINVFASILSLSSKYLTISPSILSRIREQVKNQIKNYTQNIKKEFRNCGLTQYCQFFMQSLVMNLNQRVLITREENFIKQISQQPKKFLWGLLLSIVDCTQGTPYYTPTYEFLIKLLISSAVMLKNPHQIKLNVYQNDYNHILPYKNAALGALNELIDKAPPQIIEDTYPDILEAVFVSVVSIPDILNLKIMKHPRSIAKKIYKHILRDENLFLQNFRTVKFQRVFNCILENLVSYSTQAHEIAVDFLNIIMNETSLALHQLLYGNTRWEQVCDPNSLNHCQSKYSLFDFSNWKEQRKVNYPIVSLVRNLLRIAHNINQQSIKNNSTLLKMLRNCFATFQILISIRYENSIYQAFQMLVNPTSREDGADQNISFHQTFKKIMVVAQQIITINDKTYQNFTKIIIQQTSAPNPQTGAPGRPPAALPPASREPLGRAREGQPATGQNSSQSFNINTNTFIDDEQYGLNIQDLDMQVKAWGRLISAILKFLKNILINDSIFTASKQILKKKTEKSKLIETRLQIIFVMFELIGRVDKSVRETAYQCLKQLLSKQQHPKDLIQNDQKLKHILRPVLISLQLDFKKFTPSFLHMFKKILKLLTQCFNITLVQKLLDKLRQMEKTKQNEAANQSKPMPTQQNVKHLNYSEITLETKCIASFLGLFQHLAYAYHNHRSNNYTVNSIILIFKYVVSICNYFTPKLGKFTIKTNIKTTLARVLNTMCEKISGESIFVEGQERQLDLQNFLELIKLEDSFPLREKLTRETSYIDKALAQFSKNKTKKEYLTFLEIIHVFTKNNNKWLKNFTLLSEKIIKELNQVVQVKYSSRYEERRQFELNEKNEIILLSKILLEYIKQNPQDLKALFTLVSVFKLRSTLDLHFIRKYLKYELYERTTAEIKRSIMIEYLNMLKNLTGDTERVIAISQNIIYHFVLIEVNKEQIDRTILIDNQQIMKGLSQTIKVCLNPRNLHNKGLNQANLKQSANNYRIAIEVLQISNLALGALKNFLSQANRSSMLLTVWGLLRIQDKIIKNYAFVWTSNYIRTFDGFDTNKALGLYLTLIRGLESLSQGDYEIGALIKKALNILIPYWDTKGRATNSWIDWSLKAVHEQNNEPNKLVRFWEIVVKNHKIFHKFKQQLGLYLRSKFETQMVNSMQWLMVANNPTSTNPLVKKIASDMSFIYIEWKFKQAKLKLADVAPQLKGHILEDSLNDRAAQICLNFFIKVALNNSSDKDDKQIMKRSLFLLKKTLILWPNTKKKFQAIKVVVNKLKSSNSNVNLQNNQMPLRFHYTLLNIIHILLLYEQDAKIVPQLTSIFKLLELGGHIAPPRFANTNPHSGAPGSTIFTMNNIYLLNLLCLIIRRLVVIAMAHQKEEESQRLLQEIHQYIRDGFEFHVLSGNKGRINPPPQQTRTTQQMKKIEIEVAICFLKILFDADPKSIEVHLNYIKQVTSSLKKMFQKGFQTSSKNNSPNRVYELPPLVEGSFQEMLKKDLEINVELIKPQNLVAAQQNYEKDNIKSYATRRPLFVILLRILAAKFNYIGHSEDQSNILDILMSIYERIPDPQLKLQVINIFKCMFIGENAFPQGVPQRYALIKIIQYPIRKVFHLLFEDSNKFNEHFERRKSKPSDQNYNINQRIYQEITTKVYFNFLCQFIIYLPEAEMTPAFLPKIKIFVLYAIKVADHHLLDQLFDIIDKAYDHSILELYVNLFEDYRELNCTEEDLQGDQIALFFTFYLYKRAIRKYDISVEAFGSQISPNFHNYFLAFLKSDVASNYHQNALSSTLSLSINLLPKSKNLPKILKEYLLNGSYNPAWGLIVLKLAIQKDCLNPQQLCLIASKINEWGLLLKNLQNNNDDSSKFILDYTYRAYGDKDLIYGYRLCSAQSQYTRNALMNIQQRKYVQTLRSLQNDHNSEKRSLRDVYGSKDQQLTIQQGLWSLMDESQITDIVKECYKNLNQWDELLQKPTGDINVSTQFLFHSHGNKEKINNVLGELSRVGQIQFPYYYGTSVVSFMQSSSSQNKSLNVSLLYALLEWLSFPKNAKYNQNKMLVKIECLLQLQEGQKIKEESLAGSQEQPSLVDALTKVVQSVYTQINSWRERMPDKNEDLSVWHAILGQRIMIYDFMKTKMVNLLDSVVKNQSSYGCNISTGSEKLLIPYTDIEWNKLKIIKQERHFQVFNQGHQNFTNTHNLYLDELFLRDKERFYDLFLQKKDHHRAIQLLDTITKQLAKDHKDEELFKIQKSEIARLRAKVLVANGNYHEANALIFDSLKGIEQHLLPLWRDWLVMSLKAYQETNEAAWAQSALSILPYALRYKTHKTKLILAPVLKIISNLQKSKAVVEIMNSVVDHLPIKPFLLWLPQVIRIAQTEVRESLPLHMFKILQKLAIYFPQSMYYCIKPFFKAPQYKSVKDVFLAIKKIYYNLVTKLQSFAQLLIEINIDGRIRIQTLGCLSKCLAELHLPLYEAWRGQIEPQDIPTIAQVSQHIQFETINGKVEKVITLLGSDGRDYKYRLEGILRDQKPQLLIREYQGLLFSQTLQMVNNHLSYWRQSSIRKLRLNEDRRLYLFNGHQEVRMARSNAYTLTPLDILDDFMDTKTTFSHHYPESDKALLALPKAEINRTINKRMRQIVSPNVLKDYLVQKALNFDDFISFRKVFSYQYGTLLCYNYLFSLDTSLQSFFINIQTGGINLSDQNFNYHSQKLSPFSVRLSLNFRHLFGDTYINTGVLPAFLATADALVCPKLNFRGYIDLLYSELGRLKEAHKGDLFERVDSISHNYEKIIKILDLAKKVGEDLNVPYNLKFWF